MTTGPHNFPPVSELLDLEGLPDPFVGPDGRRIQSVDEWPGQREYLKALVTHYMHGSRPPIPTAEEVAVRQVFSRSAFDDEAVEERYTLTIENDGRSCDLDIWLFRPPGDARFPTVVKNCHHLFDLETPFGPSSEEADAIAQGAVERDLRAARDAVNRGYVLCKFPREQLAVDSGYKTRRALQGLPLEDHRQLGIYPLYPGYDWGGDRRLGVGAQCRSGRPGPNRLRGCREDGCYRTFTRRPDHCGGGHLR